MARKKTAAPKHVEPEDESQDVEEPEAGEKGISKAAAVREALAQGKDGPEDGTDYIRSQYGIEMTRQSFSSYKAQEKARQAKKAPKGTPGRKPRKVVEVSQVPPVGGEAGLIEALEAMKPLVASLGADKVKRLVDLLG